MATIELCNANVKENEPKFEDLVEIDGLIVMPNAEIEITAPPILIPQNYMTHCKHLFRYKVSKKKVESDSEEEPEPEESEPEEEELEESESEEEEEIEAEDSD